MTTTPMHSPTFRRLAFALAALFALVPRGSAAQDPTRPPVIVEYHHLDATGSVRVTTDAAGNVLDRGAGEVRYDYDAWGLQTTAACGDVNDALLYAGKTRDRETCLDDFGARYYRSDIGRFTGIDPALDVAAAIADPQQWNRYAYAKNSPLTVTDPDGEAGKLITAAIKLAVKGGDVYSTVSGSVEAAQTIFSMDARVGTGERLLAVGTLLADLSGASDAIGAAKSAGNVLHVAALPSAQRLTGQLHHVISKVVHRALERHPVLSGLYKARDPRLTTRAVDGAAHRGYQTWHRQLDNEVSEWLELNRDKSQKDFEEFLRQRYSEADLRARFPELF